jgi:hypothetical protein
MDAGYRSAVGAWAELEIQQPELAAFGRERFERRVVFHASLRRDGAPRLHPVSPWFGAGLMLVAFRARSPKNDEVRLDGRYAMHSAIDAADHEGEGGEFLVRGWMERVSNDHPGAIARPYQTPYELATYACSVEEAVATTYDGEHPVYRRWSG